MSLKRDKIQKELDATSQEVASLGLAERTAFFIVLQQIEVELSANLAVWLADVPDTSVKATKKHIREIRRTTKGTIEAIKIRRPQMVKILSQSGKRSVTMAEYHTGRQSKLFAQAHGEGIGNQPPKPPTKPPKKVTRLLVDKYPKSVRKYAGELERHLRRQFTMSELRGESMDAMIHRIIRLSSPTRMLDPATAMAKGLMQRARSDAARLIRTESIYAYNTMQLEGIRDLAVYDDTILKRWDSSLDRRGCLVCRELDGEVQKVEDPFSTGVMHPPQHPNCRCTVLAWSKRWHHDSKQSTGTEGIDAPATKQITSRSQQRAPAK